jgi:hypothetical protein
MRSMAEAERCEGKWGSLVVSAMRAMVSFGDASLKGVSPHRSSYLQGAWLSLLPFGAAGLKLWAALQEDADRPPV